MLKILFLTKYGKFRPQNGKKQNKEITWIGWKRLQFLELAHNFYIK